jgi:hypothetical protein
MSTTHVLVKWDTNWADEMDIAGFAIMERKTWNEYKENLRKKKHPFSICIGTNEEIEYDSGADRISNLKSER